MTPTRESTDALRFAGLLFEAAREAGVEHPVFEIRAMDFVEDPGFRLGGTNAGYFDRPEALAAAALSLDKRQARGVFVTLNPCDPALLARAGNRIQPRSRTTTADANIVRRVWLLIDVDPVRPSGISASDDELRKAAELAKRIRGALSQTDGWPEPITAASGNGAHLLYRVDLPNDEESRALIKKVLETLARRFDTDAVRVDKTVHNASRISKVYGTAARKGDPLDSRPHRVARLGPVPDHLNVVSRNLLEGLVAAAQPVPEETTGVLERARQSADADVRVDDGFLGEFISRHALKVASRKRGERGQDVFVLEVCPFNSDHARDGGGGGSAVLTRESDGKLGFMCHHNGCAGNDWKALRALLEPDPVQDTGGTSGANIVLGNGLTAQVEWRGQKVVVMVFRNEAVAHVDRADPSSARSRAALMRKLTTAVGVDDAECAVLDRHLVTLAASGPPPSAAEPDRPSVVDSDPEPWGEEVCGASLLDELAAVFRKHVVLPEYAAETLALWVTHTYAYEKFRHTPRLLLTSPDKRCGKSRLLGVIQALVSRPLAVEGVTAAAMFRVIEAFRPTLLLDEADTYLRGRDVSEDLRGVINAGHARGGRVLRCVGDDHVPTPFRVFSPVVLAMIGRPPGTVEDRSIAVPMRRRKAAEPIARLRPGTSLRDDLEHLRRKCRRWVDDHGDNLVEFDPQIPHELDDRAADHWLPLFAIAETAGGPWTDGARAAAVAMTRTRNEDDADSDGVLLLRDLWGLFEEGRADHLATASVLASLGKMDERPWPEFGRAGRPITAQQMANLLRPFGVRPANLRIDGGVVKGYRAVDCREAWSRYTPRADPLHATLAPQLVGGQSCSGVADEQGDAYESPDEAVSGACGSGSDTADSGRAAADDDRETIGGVRSEMSDDELEVEVVELLRIRSRSTCELRDAVHGHASEDRIQTFLELLQLLERADYHLEKDATTGQSIEVWFWTGNEPGEEAQHHGSPPDAAPAPRAPSRGRTKP